jgi:hypothetical protein
LRELSTDELHQAHDLLERLLNADHLTPKDLRRLQELLRSGGDTTRPT